MKKIFFVLFSALALFTACDDTTDSIGGSLTRTEDLITVTDGTFGITSRTVVVDSVLAKSITGYLGTVKDPETGTYITSNFTTQFHTFENFALPKVSELPKGIKADSCQVRLYYTSYYGDSLATMKATLYELEKPLEENQQYYSSYSPEESGLIRLSDNALKVSQAYTLANGNYTDSLRHSNNYVDNITFNLNEPYTDRNGKQYNNYGTYLMQKYYDNPDNYKNSYNFIHNVCPGFYIKSENGVGCMAYIYLSQLNTYFQYKDTTEHTGIANFSGTEEVRQFTEITNDKQRIQQLAEDNTCTYIKSPAGLYTELTLPVEQICNGHENDSITSAKLEIPCYSNASVGRYKFNAPASILMIRVADAAKFFEENKIADNRVSYISKYASKTNKYAFSNIGELIKRMYNEMPKDAAMREAWKAANPQWNKVLLIPVKATYTTYRDTEVLTSVTHDMSLSSVRLIGGSENPHNDIQVSVIYSKFADTK